MKGETVLVRAVLQALDARGVWAWRTNAGVFGSRRIRGAPEGTPDILGVLPGGGLFGIECKTERGKQNEAQRAWQAKAVAIGVRYGLARSLAEAMAQVEAWRADVERERAA